MASIRPPVADRSGDTGATPAPGRVGTIGILIVDDDPVVAEVLAACCDEPDLQVLGIVHNADDALMATASVTPDLVLMDRRLPGRSGIDLAGDMLGLAPRMKIIIVTADPSPEVERAATLAGCAACIGKTMNIGELLPGLIRDVCGSTDERGPGIVAHPRG